MNMMEVDQTSTVVLDINNAVEIQKNLSEALDRLRNKVILFKSQREDDSAFAVQLRRNGTGPGLQHLQTGILEKQMETIAKHWLEFKDQNQQIANIFKNAYCTMEGLVNCLTVQIEEWQSQFQLHYAKLMAQPDLDKIAQWCAEVGQIMHKILHESFESWGKILQNVPVVTEAMMTEYETQKSAFRSLMTCFIQSTFLVSEQGDFFIKTLKKCFPTFRLRILAADFCENSTEVSAHFVAESDLKPCINGDDLDIETLKRKELKITLDKKHKSLNKLEMSTLKGKQKMECCFENLQFVDTFKRKQKKDSKVHEEKFRVVFITRMESKTCWTMSLPLVVITASNQDISSLASIMWQCFSTKNVFSLEEVVPAELPWYSVAEMLKKKMSVISKSHRSNLTKDNITHLKNRMFGVEDQPDDTPVSLTQFCCLAMPDGSTFSFWKWFLGICNLIEGHLVKYWDDGLIVGFVKKEDAEKMLLNCDRSGTFILRFSDKLLDDRDGYKNVFGHLTSSILCKRNKAAEETGNKRNIFGQHDIAKETVIEHVKIKDFSKKEDGPPENLADILKKEPKPLYRFLFPSLKPRKELFDKYCTDKRESCLDGYRNASDVDIAADDMERDMANLDLGKQVVSSPSSQADQSSVAETRTVKKPRRSKERLESDEKSNQEQTDCFSSVSIQQVPFKPMQSPCTEQRQGLISVSLIYEDGSPAQSVPDSALQGHVTHEVNGDSVVPDSLDNARLPTVLEGMEICETTSRGNHINYQNNSSEKTFGEAVPCYNRAGENGPVLDTSFSETTYSVEGHPVIMHANSAVVGGVTTSNRTLDFSVNDADMNLGDVISSVEEGSSTMNEIGWLLNGGVSAQDGGISELEVGSDIPAGEAVVHVDGTILQNVNTLVLTDDVSMSLGGQIFDQSVLFPNQSNRENCQEVGSCENDTGEKNVGLENHNLLDPFIMNQEIEPVLSLPTRNELKKLLTPDGFRKILLLIKEDINAVPATPTSYTGQNIADSDDIETDMPFTADTEFDVADIDKLNEQDNSFEIGLPDLGDLDGILNGL
ncbi:signal transducer and activator of transcription 5A-like [Mercenaria mercenaria]|uniref:signal transducer and activator of transcription 5A-like n=1 Tax=Mercenaria mercenaria TaxID=6596 RepID=UPI00234F120C|nr:signal transducer and activator of transcription 5A-like [Mercenaria mercenaria]